MKKIDTEKTSEKRNKRKKREEKIDNFQRKVERGSWVENETAVA